MLRQAELPLEGFTIQPESHQRLVVLVFRARRCPAPTAGATAGRCQAPHSPAQAGLCASAPHTAGLHTPESRTARALRLSPARPGPRTPRAMTRADAGRPHQQLSCGAATRSPAHGPSAGGTREPCQGSDTGTGQCWRSAARSRPRHGPAARGCPRAGHAEPAQPGPGRAGTALALPSPRAGARLLSSRGFAPLKIALVLQSIIATHEDL